MKMFVLLIYLPYLFFWQSNYGAVELGKVGVGVLFVRFALFSG